MKKLITLLLLVLFGLASAHANADLYRLNNEAVDQMFAGAESVEFFTPNAMAPLADFAGTSYAFVTEEKNAAVAFILAWAVGYLGIHRAYLGTSTGTIVAYILTLGGCGIVALVDWVILLLELVGDKDISKYVDNPKFFMW